eukprot:305988_1
MSWKHDHKKMDAELDVNRHLLNSMHQANQALDTNQNIILNMMQQGRMTNKIHSSLSVLLTETFSQASTIMKKINKYKNRDSIVLAIVLAISVFLMMLYWLQK